MFLAFSLYLNILCGFGGLMMLMPPLIADSAAFLLLLLPLIAVSFAFFMLLQLQCADSAAFLLLVPLYFPCISIIF